MRLSGSTPCKRMRLKMEIGEWAGTVDWTWARIRVFQTKASGVGWERLRLGCVKDMSFEEEARILPVMLQYEKLFKQF